MVSQRLIKLIIVAAAAAIVVILNSSRLFALSLDLGGGRSGILDGPFGFRFFLLKQR